MLPKELDGEGVQRPANWKSPELTNLELHLDYQSLCMDSQPVGLKVSIYAVKGNMKESGRLREIFNQEG